MPLSVILLIQAEELRNRFAIPITTLSTVSSNFMTITG